MHNFVPFMTTAGLLTISNIFMTFAWYGHLKYKDYHYPMYLVILVSWGIAFFEYCFQVPANRLGAVHFAPVELKATQEIITLVVFISFSTYFLGEPLKWNQFIGLAIMGCGACIVFYK